MGDDLDMEAFRLESTDLTQEALLFVGNHKSRPSVKVFAVIFVAAVLWRRIMHDPDGAGWKRAVMAAWTDSTDISGARGGN